MGQKSKAIGPANVGTVELASICGITERRVQQLAEQGIFEKIGRGQHRRAGSGEAYMDYCVKSEMSSRDKGETARSQFETERARKLRLENDLKDRSLIEIDDALEGIDHILGEVRTSLANILARATEDVGQRRIIEDEGDKIRAKLARRLERLSAALE